MADFDPGDLRGGHVPGAWRAADCGGIEGLMRRMSREQLDAIDAAVEATQGKDAVEVTAADFGAEPIVALMQAVAWELAEGKGVAVLSGVDLSRYDLEAFKRLYFGLGTHLGTAVVQSPRLDKIGLVRKEPNPDLRGYLMDIELGPHTDYHELLSLATVVASDDGGVSGFVSAAAVYEIVREERPDLLPALLEGYYYPTSLSSVTDYKVPSLSIVDGQVSMYNYALFPFQAAEILGTSVPAPLVEAMRFVNSVTRRPGMRASFTMQPGEMAFWYNFRVFHSRTAFRNSPDRERLLLRLWLHAHRKRAMARGYDEIAHLLDALHAQGTSILVNTDASMKAAHAALRG
jgi:hypothetical protein